MRTTILIIIGLFFTTFAFGQVIDSTDKIKDPIEYAKKESIGGKLDFNLIIEKENKVFYLYDGIAYNKKDFAIFLWGKAVNRLGISSSKKASDLWTEIHKRELTGPEKTALKRGFEVKAK